MMRRIRLFTALALAAAFMAAPATAYAFSEGTQTGVGPGFSPPAASGQNTEAKQEVGPGFPGSGSSGSGTDTGADTGTAPVIPDRIDYFSQPVADPTVIPVEKYSYDTMVQDLNRLKARYGDRLHVNVYGTSLDGRELYEAVLGDPNAEKHVLIHAGIHAREYMTPLLVMKQLEYGLEFYDTGSYDGHPLSEILSHVAVHFVPMTNPDGTTLSQFGMEGIRSEQLRQAIEQCYAYDLTLSRATGDVAYYLSHWKANARGVDLNQNFPADWEQVVGAWAPSYATYRGPSALSEPESQALAALTASRHWSATISYHSMGNLIYWDYAGNRVQQNSGEIATLVAATTGYQIGGSSGHGGYKDWVQIKEDAIPSITIETGGVACPMPLDQYQDVWERNKMVWALVAEYAWTH